MDSQQINRLRVLWKSGRDKYSSFFAVFNEVRREIGDENLPSWCVDNLHISLSIIDKMAGVLGKVDEKIVRADLAAAKRMEKEKRALEKAKRDSELAAIIAKKAEYEAEKARCDKEKEEEQIRLKKLQSTERKRQLAQDNPNSRGDKASVQRRKREAIQGLPDADLAELMKRYQSGERMCTRGINYWVEGSIVKAKVLCAIRAKFPADQDFGAWLVENGIDLQRDTRAALIGLGRLEEGRLREILTNTESRSYRVIWQEHKPTLSVVEN